MNIRIEIMIYVYGAICLSMIVFNLVHSILLRRSQPKLEKQSARLTVRTMKQVQALKTGGDVATAHLAYLQRVLRRVNRLIAFDTVLKRLPADAGDMAAKAYLHRIQPVLIYLAMVYQKRDDMQAGYFSWFLTRHGIARQMQINALQEMLLDFVAKDNLYCRVHALHALYRLADAEHVLAALKIQDKGDIFLHEKILTEGLLSFSGDHHRLIRRLWDAFDSFTERSRLAILNYIRFTSDGYASEMFSIMMNDSAGKELRLSAIRYFGRYFHSEALLPLLAFVRDQSPMHWEYATAAAASLARYRSPTVVSALKEALRSYNWYVRQAASLSLEAHQLDYSDLIDIVAGSDRYASEMMMYRLESRNIRKTVAEET